MATPKQTLLVERNKKIIDLWIQGNTQKQIIESDKMEIELKKFIKHPLLSNDKKALSKKAKVIYISKGPGVDLDEENKPYHFYIMCDKLCNKEGVEVKNAMVAAGKPVTREEFVKNCSYAEDMFEYESQMLDDPSVGFYKSNVKGNPCYYMQYAGFEFIFTKNSKEKPYWVD